MTESTSHVEQQVQARIAAARVKIQAAKERRASLAETRRAGLARRHAAKLRRLAVQEQRLYKLTASAERRYETASPASPNSPDSALSSGNRGDAEGGTLASPTEAGGTLGDAEGDAALFTASPHGTTSDLRENGSGNAGDAGDAEMQPLSTAVTCTGCGYPLDVTEPGQTTHPTC